MPGTEQPNDDLQAAITDDTIFIRVAGRGSFKIAAPLKQFIAEVALHRPISTVVIDLKECIGMDSTFMGVLAGLSGRLKKTGQTLELINLSTKKAELLKTLGVDQVLSFYKDAHGHPLQAQETESIPTDQASKKEMAETALQAHENLVQISEENLPRFKRVIDFLKEDVNRLN
jgi:anti-sigma B factor antagonist